MKKHSAIIIDDEQGSIDALIWELENYKDKIEVIDTTTSPKEGIRLLKDKKPDILFLDIEMPGMTGFELLEKVPKLESKVIFTTAYDQFALKAFEAKAYDYLLKPVEEEDLGRAIEKAIGNTDNDAIQETLAELINKIDQNKKGKNIALPTQDGLEFVSIDNIIRCESDSNYTHLHIEGEKSIFVAKTLKDVELLIASDNFFRIHHSHLINLNYLKQYKKGKAGSVILKDGSQIPVSRSRKGDFLDGV